MKLIELLDKEFIIEFSPMAHAYGFTIQVTKYHGARIYRVKSDHTIEMVSDAREPHAAMDEILTELETSINNLIKQR